MPRISLPSLETMTPEQRKVYDKIVTGKRGRIQGPLRAALHNPDLAERWSALGELLRYGTTLTPRQSELAILVTGRLCRSPFEWYAHRPEAEKAGVILGLENTISAEDNVRIMDRAQSKAVLVYYDIGNSTLKGFNVVREIDWLGKKRICQMHFKDNPNYLGEGKIDMEAVLRAVSRIGFDGFANLETDSPSKSIETDMKRNLSYVRRIITEIR